MHALKKKCCIPSAARPFQCELCSKAFAKKEHLKKHLRTHSGLRPYVCDTCGKGFTRRGNRDRHTEIHLGTQRPKPTDETVEKEVFTFDFEVSSQHSLSAVDEQEQPNQKFRCSECPYSTDYKGNLDRHLMTHSGERPHQCLLCDKTFARKSDVKRHLLIHTKEGFQSDSATACDCDVCSGALEGERRCLRLPDRKFHCTECRYSTNHKANLETHFLSHSGERPHQCELCDKAFTRKEHLSRHLRSHTGERPFSCDKCGKRFTRGTTLRHHEVATKGECHLTKASNTEQ